MRLTNKLKNVGIGMVALSGLALSSCEKDNDKFEEMREAQIKEQKEKTLDQLSGHPYINTSPNSTHEERIFFDKENREVTLAETYKTEIGSPVSPVVFKDQETYNIQNINLDKDKVEVEGHPDIKIEGDCHAYASHPRKVRDVQTNGKCYHTGDNPSAEDLANLGGEQKYLKKYSNADYDPDTVELSFRESPQAGETYSLMEGHPSTEGPTKGYSFEDNGRQSDYTTAFDVDGDGKGDTLYMRISSPYEKSDFPYNIELVAPKEDSGFKSHLKYGKLK